MRQFHIGMHTYAASLDRSFYYIEDSLIPAYRNLDTLNTIKSYDHVLHQSLDKIFSEHCLNDSEQIKKFLRVPQHNTDYNSVIKPILAQEPFLSRYFSKEEFSKLSLLWIAVLCCYEKSAELLVRSGADVNELFGRRDPQVIHEKWTVLHVLVRMDPSPENERLIRLVINHGADLQARDSRGRTALLYAVVEERVQMIELLLEEGADVNAADNDGVTPVLAAVSYSRKCNELVPLLMEHGADVFAQDRYGRNVLHHLVHINSEGVDGLARLLVEKGVSLENGDNSSEYTPIQMAVQNGSDKMVELCLDHGVNVDVQNKDGKPLLYLAAQFVKNTIVETLLERGAKIDLRTTNGRTALHVACQKSAQIASRVIEFNNVKNITAIIELLLSAGADVLVEDCDGNTPFALISSGLHGEPPGTRLLIKELALKKALQPSIELKDERIIERYPKLLDHYRKCIKEIDRMKSKRFIKSCTFFQLLSKSYCRIAALMRNPKFESKFKQCDLNEFPIYNENLLRAFERAQKHYQPMLKQEEVISEAFYYTLPDLVVDKVVHYVFNCCE